MQQNYAWKWVQTAKNTGPYVLAKQWTMSLWANPRIRDLVPQISAAQKRR